MKVISVNGLFKKHFGIFVLFIFVFVTGAIILNIFSTKSMELNRAGDLFSISNSLYFLPSSILGSLSVILLANLFKNRIRSIISYLGENSLAIFLLHVLFVAGSRIIIMKIIGNLQSYLLIPILSVIGIIGPLIVLEIVNKLKIQKLSGLA